MGREHLEGRDNWQHDSAVRGTEAERRFDAVMKNYLRGSGLEGQHKPEDLRGIYGRQPGSSRPHGIVPEYVIRNPATNRAVYVEVKRQRAAGNAHERACKYFAPGIVASAQEIANQPRHVLPFWWVFTNGIASAPRYVQEIQHWFIGYEGNMLLWESLDDFRPVVEHFDMHIKPMLQ